ncbi:MAG: chromate transporter [Ignavibacteria bacterium]|nr:chromate transporter [Ignavibacteria bacterium]MBI3766178.1 chromate transporter [Ignavibacteriales bacterium]
MTSDDAAQALREYSLQNLVLYFLKLGTTGFGGPIALVGYMERDLVEQRRWITKDQYLRGLALAQLAPGPLAAQVAIYIGYLKGRVLGATLIGIAFILPSFLMVVALGMLYVSFGGLAWMQAVFYGIGAAVIGIIIKSAYKLTKLTLKGKAALWIIFVIMCATTAYTEQEILWLFLLSGVVALFILAPPKSFDFRTPSLIPPLGLSLTQLPDLSHSETLTKVFLFFAKAGAFVFGSGLAIVPFLYGGVVQEYRWLNERQFLDAVAVAMITPGPVVITVGFIGYLVAGLPGALAAALGVFLPVYLFVVIPAPYVERYAKNPQLNAFVDGVTAAATGAIAGAVIVLGRRAIIDVPTAIIAAVTLAVLIRFKVPEPIIVLAAGLLGLALFPYKV